MKSFSHDYLPSGSNQITKLNFVTESKLFKQEVVRFGVPGREIITGVRTPLLEPEKYHWLVDPVTNIPVVNTAGDKTAVSLYELDSTRTGKLTAEGLSDFQYARTEYSLQHGLYIGHSHALLSHFFARISADSLATIETSDDFALLYSSMDTLGLWTLLENSHLHGSSRQKNLMLTQFLSFRQSGSHEHYLSSFNDQAIRVLSAFESVDPQHKGYISFDVLKRSTYLNGVDQSFFARHIDIALEDSNNSLSTTQKVQAYFQAYYLERGPTSVVPAVDGATTAALIASSISKLPEVYKKKSRAPMPGTCPLHLCPHCWSKGYANAHSLASCEYKDRRKLVPVVAALIAGVNPNTPPPAIPSADQSFVDSYRANHQMYQEAVTRLAVHHPPPTTNLGLCAYALLSDASDSDAWYFDGCATVSLVNRLQHFDPASVTTVSPFRVGGLSDGITVTHSGRIPWLPESMNLAYYSAELKVSLISLGVIQQAGGSYRSDGSDHLDVFRSDGVLIDHAQLGINRLPVVSSHIYKSVSLRPFALAATGCLTPLPWEDCSSAFLAHVNAEQRLRCDRVEDLHNGIAAHCSDDVLVEALHHGRFPWSNVTPADVRLNRSLRGPCPQCAEGKLRAKAMPSSLTEPASSVGGVITFDLRVNAVRSPGGNMVGIRSVDEWSGDCQYTAVVSKHAPNIAGGLLRLVHNRYNKYGHRVTRMVADAEPALVPVIEILATAGIHLSLVDPGQHAQRAERSVQTVGQRRRAVLAGLPYYMPLQYCPYAERWVCDTINGLPNSRSRPSTADILVTGQSRPTHYKYPGLGFGAVCMVRQFKVKRATMANNSDHPQLVEDVPIAELGVLLGYAVDYPGDYDFLLANGSIVPRRVLEVVQVNPFDWKRKLVLKAELPPPCTDPEVPEPVVKAPQSHVQMPPVPIAAHIPTSVSPSLLRPPVLPQTASVNAESSATLLHEETQRIAEVPCLPLPVTVAPFIDQQRVATAPATATVVATVVSLPTTEPVVSPTKPVVPCHLPISITPPTITSTRPVRHPESTLAPGFWRGAACAPVNLSEEDGWITVGHGRNKKPFATRIDHPNVLSSSLVDPDISLSKSAEDIFNNKCIAFECDWFNTIQPYEYDLDSAVSSVVEANRSTSSTAYTARIGIADLLPEPITKCKEFGLGHALRNQDREKLIASTAVEMKKQQSLGCLGTLSFDSLASLPAGCGVVDAHVIYKDKADGRSTCRIAGRGDRLPLSVGEVTHASVASDADKMLTLSLMQAHCAKRGESLAIRDYDIVGGFLHIKRTSKVRLFLRLPTTLPHPMAGKFLEIHGALYGLRESNRLFSLEVARVLSAAGFTASSVSPMTFVKHSLVDPGIKCCVNTHVDDFRTLDNDRTLTASLVTALETRFGALTCHDPSTSFTGVEFKQQTNGAILASQDMYIARVASSIGIDHMGPVTNVAHDDFFRLPLELPDSENMDPIIYQSLTGHLIQLLKTRDEIRPYVSFLCAQNGKPTKGAFARALHVLRYLKSSPGVGRVFYSMDTNICAHSDASSVPDINGCSTGGHFLSVGAHNAPFVSFAKAQDDVATCPMTAEYYSAGECCKSLIHFRQLATDLGWPQLYPTSLFLDNRTALSLVNAPEGTRKARHIPIRYHYIRQLAARKVICVIHVSSAKQRADILTKYLPIKQFLLKRSCLLNSFSLPSPLS